MAEETAVDPETDDGLRLLTEFFRRQQTGSSTQTGDAAGRYIPFYTVGILAGFAALAALFKKKSQGDIKSQD